MSIAIADPYTNGTAFKDRGRTSVTSVFYYMSLYYSRYCSAVDPYVGESEPPKPVAPEDGSWTCVSQSRLGSGCSFISGVLLFRNLSNTDI